jgi:acyl-coenzyme A synthetase/AMP-(fatty) acid ligase
VARYHPDGVFVVLGRKDRMVKINGQRLELAEIETALRRIATVERAEVIVTRTAAAPRIVAFVVPAGHADRNIAAELRAALRVRLPPFMIPAQILPVAAIPLLPGGKVDTLALMSMAETPIEPGVS